MDETKDPSEAAPTASGGWIAAAFSLIAPGAGQALDARAGRGAAAMGLALAWRALGGLIAFRAVTAVGPEAVKWMPLIVMLFPAVILLIHAGAAVDAARLPTPEQRRWIPALLFVVGYWLVGGMTTRLMQGAAVGHFMGEAAGKQVKQAIFAQRAADQVAEEIRKLPPGPFTADRKGNYLVDRYENRYPLPQGYEGKGEPLAGVADGQKILLYPPLVAQRMALPSANDSEHKWMEMGMVTVIVQKGEASRDPQHMAKYEAMLRGIQVEKPELGAVIEQRSGLSLPALVMRIRKPAHDRVFLFGAKEIYIFSGAPSSPALELILEGFKEGPANAKGL